VTHEQAWAQLPDLLADRDQPALLAHVRACQECQRQLFLLGRVDRLLQSHLARDRAAQGAAAPPARSRRRPIAQRALASAAAVAAAGALAFALVIPPGERAGELVFRTQTGTRVAQALMSRSDPRNVSLALTAEGLPVDRGDMYELWSSDAARTGQPVGRFMVDRRGACRVKLNLANSRAAGRYWIARAGDPADIVATT
jgi:hypothetical protein